MDIDKVITSIPVDRTASIVTSKGFNFQSNKKILNADQSMPIEIQSIPRHVVEDLTGVKRGRLTVVGYSRNNKGRWVVRCDCGIYTLRRHKSIKNEQNDVDRCEACRETLYFRRRQFRLETGRYIETKELE